MPERSQTPRPIVVDCPARKLVRPGDASAPEVERRSDAGGERWVVRSFDVARQVLRSPDVTQAGFNAEAVYAARGRMRPPILYLEGRQHRIQRSAAARLFAPAVTEGYRAEVTQLSERLVATVPADRPVDLKALATQIAMQVAARIVGLTQSSLPRMSRRLDTFFESDHHRRLSPLTALRWLRRSSALLRFYHLDVRPAIRAHRRTRTGDDVIGQLVDAGYGDLDILTECITYAAAGMVTTAELITVTVWHLMEDSALCASYRAGDRDHRTAVIREILRLEPAIGQIYRRTTAPVRLSTAAGEMTLPPGKMIDIDVRATNTDADVVPESPSHLHPNRHLPKGVPPTAMSFGDGNHRCPGGPLALLETEIFVSALLTAGVVAEGAPRVRWNDVTQGYQLDRLYVRRRSAP